MRKRAWFRALATILGTLLSALLTFSSASRAESARGGEVWLALSDIHLDISDRSSDPSRYGVDSNQTLFESALAQMKRAAPAPAVVLLPGDFLMHDFAQHAVADAATPDEAGIRTMRWIAAALNRAFPKAQFAIALGNNDAPCGDYRSADSAYLATVANIWAPLVNRRSMSPNFSASFLRGGYYTAFLPVRGLRLVVLNTTLFSSEYRGDCGGDDFRAASKELVWLDGTLRASPSGTRNVVMMHVPPGFDPFSTEYTHGLLPVAFLQRRYDAALVGMLAASRDRVAYAIAGHAHRFDFRLAGRVPIIVLGSLSPIYGNNPAFYTLKISPDGSLSDIGVYAFDESTQAWQPSRSFDATWDAGRIDGSSLAQLHGRLANVAALRVLWDRQADGWPSGHVDARGTWGGSSWRVFWCAQPLPMANFARCAGIQWRPQMLLLLAAIVVTVTVLIVRTVIRAPEEGTSSAGRMLRRRDRM